MTRREMLVASGAALSMGSLGSFSSCITRKRNSSKPVYNSDSHFQISLNSSTIRNYKLPVDPQIELCAEAGFNGVELWGGGAASQLSDVAAIAIGAAHPRASLLLDFYHLHKGDNSSCLYPCIEVVIYQLIECYLEGIAGLQKFLE